MDQDHVFILMSFLVDKKGEAEKGHTFMFKTWRDVECYIQKLKDGKDDRPFECRWNYFVVEKVFFGPYSQNEVMGWWEGIKQDNGSILGYDIVKLETSPYPNAKHIYNFVGVG